jgi:hypothetical protein
LVEKNIKEKIILKKKNMKTSWNLFIFLVSSYIRHSVSGDDNYEGGLNPTPTRKQLPTYLTLSGMMLESKKNAHL